MRQAFLFLCFAAALTVGCGGPDVGDLPKEAPPTEPDRPEGNVVAGKFADAAFFTDRTDAAGIRFAHEHGGDGTRYLPETMAAGGCALDYDGDGRVDLYFVQSGVLPGTTARGPAPTNRLYRNLGNGRFEDVTGATGTGDAGYGAGAVSADYDNDGDADLYVLNYGPNRLFRNEGDGTFRDVSAEAGVDDAGWGSSAVFFDADGDGRLDLYVVNYLEFTVDTHVACGTPSIGRVAYCHPDVYPSAPDVLYRNRGDGTFEDVTAASGIVDRTGKGLGAVATDVDNDGDPDLYVANDSTPNFLFVNRGDGTFEESGLISGVGYNEEGLTEAGMGVDAGDVNGDEYVDLFVTNFSRETNALYLGGPGGFTHETRSTGLYAPSLPWVGFGTELVDLDNDGDRDLIVTNGHVIDNIAEVDDTERWRQPTQLFLNDGRGAMKPLPASEAPDLAIPRVGRGLIALDHDDDGRVDVAISYNGDRARLYRNTWPGAGHWIGFRLRGVTGNRDAIGARVEVSAGGRRTFEEVRAGSSYQSGSDLRLHFGLGRATSAERVTIRWPSGAVETLTDLPGGRYHEIVEGRGEAR